MKLNVEIITNKRTLARWNFKEEALVFYDNERHVAIPISKVTGEELRKIIKEWRLPPPTILKKEKDVMKDE